MVLSEISKYTNMKEVAEDYGFEPNKAGNICCPFHEDKTPSMKLYDDHFHCFGCGAHGDVIDFVARLNDTDALTAAKEIRDRYGLEISDKQPKASVLARLDRAKQEQEVEYFTRVLIQFCKIKERFLEQNNLPIPDVIQARTDIEYADAIFEMLMHTERSKRYEFIRGFSDVLRYFEQAIENSSTKVKFTKENEAI